MKKLLMIILTVMLVACSSGVSVDELTAKMPKNDRTFFVKIPASRGLISDAMTVGMIKISGSPSASNIIQTLSVDNVNIGIAGDSQAVNKATVLYALEKAQEIGSNVTLYMVVDSESDKADLEKAANSKNIKLHYLTNTK